jgi:hypothetical protein
MWYAVHILFSANERCMTKLLNRGEVYIDCRFINNYYAQGRIEGGGLAGVATLGSSRVPKWKEPKHF